MASTNERFVYPDSFWYDANNPGPLHEALRADYARAKTHAAKRPSLRRHMAACAECLEISGATVAAPNPLSTRKRLKLVLNKAQMHTVLRLPESFEIVHIYADNDPNVVYVLVAGEGLPESGDDDETPVGRLDDVAEDSADGAS